ncbi:hypothetical protein GCM10011369_25460 [Neiella marina]|uniref:VTT domain-containing protein n=1 Tax=Neiella marina TaxID=508461 RepID=A0A8J2U6W1_9GAMM|nr:hypothetical protein GCM10011369_25460 [Neiella marina]
MAVAALFWTSFLAATLLPGGSEAALILAWQQQWGAPISLFLAASIGNTLGGLVTFWMGWQARKLKTLEQLNANASARQQQVLAWLQHHGHWALLLSWAPVVGDLLCLAGGWLKLNPWLSAVALLIGKSLRYLIVLAAASLLFNDLSLL